MTSGIALSSNTDPALDWSMHLRVAVPDLVPGYFERPALIEQIMSTDHHIAVLKAPGGFGKTATLAAYCRRLGERGIPAAWLRFDAADDRVIIGTYLARAFRHAGVDVPEPESNIWSVVGDRAELLSRAIAAHAEPCALALDDLEQLTDPASAELLSTLLRIAPPNLCVAMACRELPLALDIMEPLLQGRVVMLTAAELRIPLQETSAFLGEHLTRQELTAIDQQFDGWPIALALHRNSSNGGTSSQASSTNLLGNWIETRLWEHLSTDQRDFLLDVGLLDRLDPVLLDEVLACNDSRYRLQAMPEFDGLIQPFPIEGSIASVLHPMLRRHCSERRFQETPERFQTIHHRAALALERRVEMVSSIRHAAEAGNPELLGRLLKHTGGLQFWALRGQFPPEEFKAFLTHDVVRQCPRIALVYCWMLAVTERIPEARHLYELTATSTDDFTRNPTGDVRNLRIDQFIVKEVFFLHGCIPFNTAEFQSAVASAFTIVQDDDLEPDSRTLLNFGLCMYENHRARFDAAFERAELVRQFISDGHLPTFTFHFDIQLGTMAMAQGHVHEAETYYLSAIRTIKAYQPEEPVYEVIGDMLLRELQFERNRLSLAMAAEMRLRENFTRPGITFAMHASESTIISEIAQYAVGVDEALAVLTEMTEYARLTERQTLIRHLAALRVAMLACAGRVTEAERSWRAAALPTSDEDCLDMQAMNWREMEVISCARLRLYTARKAFGAGREFAGLILRVAEDHRIVRTAMRVSAIAMTLERCAGDMDAACAHLETFLRHYINADYARPIVREGDAGREVLERLLDSHPEGPIQSAASDLLMMIASTKEKNASAHFTDRELVVLKLLPDLRDKQIATELSISREGVRYYLRRIFARLGAHNRREAVQRARSIGLLPQES